MRYIVMECHLSYAVVLSEQGEFIKVANMHYEVGQSVSNIVRMHQPDTETAANAKHRGKWLYSLSAAACIVLIVASLLYIPQLTYASVYLTINPEVRIDVNRSDVVVGITGTNEDGTALIANYNYSKKELGSVMDELADRAIDMGYLHEGGKITLEFDSQDGEWVIQHSNTLSTSLSEHVGKRMSVTIAVGERGSNSSEVIIPVSPDESSYGGSDYGEPNEDDNDDLPKTENSSDYIPSSPVYNQSDYGTSSSSPYDNQSSDDDGDYDDSNPQSDNSDSGYDTTDDDSSDDSDDDSDDE